MPVTSVIQQFLMCLSRLCVCHVCDPATFHVSVTVCDAHGTCLSRSVMPVTSVIQQFLMCLSRLCVCHVCDPATFHVSVTSVGGPGRGSKFRPLNFNTSFQFVFHKTDDWYQSFRCKAEAHSRTVRGVRFISLVRTSNTYSQTAAS